MTNYRKHQQITKFKKIIETHYFANNMHDLRITRLKFLLLGLIVKLSEARATCCSPSLYKNTIICSNIKYFNNFQHKQCSLSID